MKKLLALLFSILISFNSYGEWTKVSSYEGNDFYIDYDSIKKNNGYVYYWQLLGYVKPTDFGDLSSISLYEVDCKIPYKERRIAASYYTLPMGKGTPSTTDNTTYEWDYGAPGSMRELLLDIICEGL